MSTLFVCGANHKTTSLPMRERLALLSQKIVDNLAIAIADPCIHEVVLLSTCNRSEMICFTDDLISAKAWWCKIHELSSDEEHAIYSFQDERAVSHLMNVGCGLDSMVLGEPQILGQLKEAYQIAVKNGTVGAQLNLVFQFVFSACKRIRTQTAIGQEPVSCASVAISLAKYIFSDLSAIRVLLIGSGEMTLQAAQHLKAQGVLKLTAMSRQQDSAQDFANKIQGQPAVLEELSQILLNTDMVLTATGSLKPIITRAMLEPVLRQRPPDPLLLLDLALPRDIEPPIADLDGVYLYNIDDLQYIQQEGLNKRMLAAEQAAKMIEGEVKYFIEKLAQRDYVDLIKAYRNKVEILREDELQKALRLLQTGHTAEEALQAMARSITNKLMHQPSVALRQANEYRRRDMLEMAKHLLGIGEQTQTHEESLLTRETYETEY